MLANRFEILAELGQGSMGAVYRVHDTQRGAEVALKRIQTKGPITPDLELRFREEFRAMARLKHPNTIEVYDFGRLDDRAHYLTMEIVPGRELHDLLREGAMPFDRIYSLLIQLLQALGFIHSRLYVHRDIKSQNIRVTDDFTLKLMDFGLMSQLGLVSKGAQVTGTPGYMPPEVVRGGVIDAGSDLYSVGCLAFELVTGRLPFEGRVIDVVRAHVSQAPPALHTLREGVPPRLVEIVGKLLAKDPDRRYRQANEVIEDLAELAGIRVTRENQAQKQSYLTSSVLVGRERELGVLEAALAEVEAGRGASCFVGAPAGVGKTRLVQELVLTAKLRDMVVLEGSCVETGAEPYAPLAQALRPLIALSSPEELAGYGPVLVRLFPELPRRWSESLQALDREREKNRLHEALVAWIRTLAARTPIVIYLDDMQWADPQSIEVLNHLVLHLGSSRVFFLTTLRSDELSAASPAWLTVLEGATQYLKLTPFNQAQVGSLLEATLRHVRITPEFQQFLYNATSGNAFYMVELLRYLMETGVLVSREGVWHFPDEPDRVSLPESVEATVLRRVAGLSPEARALADAAAVMGRELDLGMWLSVSGLEEEAFFTRLEELIERQFVHKEDGGGYSFPHDRVREALYEALESGVRQALHRRCGLYLEQAHAEQPEAALNELAHHFSLGGDDERAYRYLRRAGDRARDLAALPVAVERWIRAEQHLLALSLPNQDAQLAQLRHEIGTRGFNIVPTVAARALEQLLQYLESPAKRAEPHNLLQRIEVYSLLAGAYGFAGQAKKGLEIAERTVRLVEPSEAPLYGALLTVFCSSLFPSGRFDALVGQAQAAAKLLVDRDLTGELPLVLTCRIGAAAYQNAVAFQGVRPSDTLADYAVWAAEQVGELYLTTVTRYLVAMWYLFTGRQDFVVAYIEEASQLCRRIGAPPNPYVLYMRPYLLWQRGELDEALAAVRQSLKYPHLGQTDHVLHLLRVLLGEIQHDRGELDVAAEAFSQAAAHGAAEELALVRMRALLGLGRLAITRQAWDEAAAALNEVASTAASGPARNPLHQAMALRELGRLALVRGERAAARARAEEALAIVSRPEQDNLIEQGHCQLLLGDLARREGDKRSASKAYQMAAERYHRIKNRHYLQLANQAIEKLQAPGLAKTAELVIPEAPKEETFVAPPWARDWGDGGASFRRF